MNINSINQFVADVFYNIAVVFQNKFIHILLLIFVLFPFIALCFYTHPQLDDFVFAQQFKKYGFWEAQVGWYNHWSGRYASNAILSICPISFGKIGWHPIISFSIILLYGLGFYILFRGFSFRVISSKQTLFISLTILAVYLCGMPSLSTGIYWGTAAIVYHLSFIFILLMLGLTLLYQTKKKMPVLYCVLIIPLLIVTQGCNEISALYASFIFFITTLYKFYKHQKLNYHYFFLFLFSLVVLSFIFTSPGIEIRKEIHHGSFSFGYTLFYSFSQSLQYFVEWLFKPGLWFLAFLYIPIGQKIAYKLAPNSLFYLHPVVGFLIHYLIVSSTFFMIIYGTGSVMPWSLNVPYFFFFIGVLFNIQLLICFFYKKKLEINFKDQSIIVLILIATCFSYENFILGYEDLLKGKTKQYKEALIERYDYLKSTKEEICEVMPITNPPMTIHYIDSAEMDFISKNYAAFFNKKEIRLKEKKKIIRKPSNWPYF